MQHEQPCVCEEGETFESVQADETVKMESENITETPEHCSAEVDRPIDSESF